MNVNSQQCVVQSFCSSKSQELLSFKIALVVGWERPLWLSFGKCKSEINDLKMSYYKPICALGGPKSYWNKYTLLKKRCFWALVCPDREAVQIITTLLELICSSNFMYDCIIERIYSGLFRYFSKILIL